LSLQEILETIPKNHRFDWEKYVVSALKKQEPSRLFFPSYLLIKIIEELWEMKNDGLPDDPTDDLPTVACASRKVLDSHKNILSSSQYSIETAIEKFSERLKKLSSEEKPEVFSEWIAFADDSHRDLILSDEFAKNFGNCLNYAVSQMLYSEKND